jgi:hypothetical protein
VNNQIKILQGINILTPLLSNYVYINLKNRYHSNWWQFGVINKLKPHQRRDLPLQGNDDSLKAKLDIDKLTLLIGDIHWNSLFSYIAVPRFRTYIRELRDIRNYFIAHLGSEVIEDRDVNRTFDTFNRILEIIDQKSYIINLNEINDITNQNLYKKQNQHSNKNKLFINYKKFDNDIVIKDDASNLNPLNTYNDVEQNLVFAAFCRRIVMRLRNDGYNAVVNESDILKWTRNHPGIANTDLRTAKKEVEFEWIVNINRFKEFLAMLQSYETLCGNKLSKVLNESNFNEIKAALENNFSTYYGIADFLQSQIMRFGMNISYNTYSGKQVKSGYKITNRNVLYEELREFFGFQLI